MAYWSSREKEKEWEALVARIAARRQAQSAPTEQLAIGNPLAAVKDLQAEYQSQRRAIVDDRDRSDEWKLRALTALRETYDQRGREVAKAARAQALAQVEAARAAIPAVASQAEAGRDWQKIGVLQTAYGARLRQAPAFGASELDWIRQERERLQHAGDSNGLFALRSVASAFIRPSSGSADLLTAFAEDERRERQPVVEAEGKVGAAEVNATLVRSAILGLETAIHGERSPGAFGGPSPWQREVLDETPEYFGAGVQWRHQPEVQVLGGESAGGEVGE